MGYSQSCTEWVTAISRVDSLADLRESISEVVVLTGFQYYIFHARFSEGDRERDDIYLDNCAPGWGTYYRERCYRNLLSLCGMPGMPPILWRQPNIASGSIHAVHGPGWRRSVMSFINGAGREVDAQIEQALPRCELIATSTHAAAVRLFERRAGKLDVRPPEATLNERERQVLTWAAAGKTASETATILSLSQRTVLFYLCSARQKLDASNSRHAICKALSLGLIDAQAAGAMAQPRWGAHAAGPKAQERPAPQSGRDRGSEGNDVLVREGAAIGPFGAQGGHAHFRRGRRLERAESEHRDLGIGNGRRRAV